MLKHPTSTLRLSYCLLGGAFPFDMHLFILCTPVALITAVQFSIFFSPFHCRLKKHINFTSFIPNILRFFFFFFSITWPKSDRPHFICYTWNYVGLDFSAQSSWPKENQDVCAGWSGCHDSDTGTPRSVHQNTQVGLCAFWGRLCSGGSRGGAPRQKKITMK